VVWHDERGGGQIFAYNLKTGEEKQLTKSPAKPSKPRIYGKYVVFGDYRYDYESLWESDIYMVNIETGEELRITNYTGDYTPPVIYGDYVAFAWIPPGTNNKVLYIYKITEGIIYTYEGVLIGCDDMYENKIVFATGHPMITNSECDIYLLEFTIKEEKPVEPEKPRENITFLERYSIPITAIVIIVVIIITLYYMRQRKIYKEEE